MSVAAIVVCSTRNLRSRREDVARSLAAIVDAAVSARFDETVAVVDDEKLVAGLSSAATVLFDETGQSELEALRVAIDWAARAGHEALVVAHGIRSGSGGPYPSEGFVELQKAAAGSVLRLRDGDGRAALCRLEASIWPAVPLSGSVSSFLEASRAPVIAVSLAEELPPSPDHVGESGASHRYESSPSDRREVAALLGRPPQGPFRVAIRDGSGRPVVIENGPFLDDGSPMPTRYWLVSRDLVRKVSRLESEQGAARAERLVSAAVLEQTHDNYARGRDALIDPNFLGPRPSGGVGGTRRGVKCLHAHVAAYLAGTGDPVGRWVISVIGERVDGPVAAIDCGTNSTRLLITDAFGRPTERHSVITRLGEDVDRSGVLSESAIDRTISCLVEYRATMDAAGVVALHAVATSAARDASNAELFFQRARDVIGVEAELLSGVDEGRLSYLGATASLRGEFLVVDLGGGSTELIAGSGSGDPVVVSLPVGCVRMTERFFSSDPPSKDELAACRAHVGSLVREALEAHPQLASPNAMIGVAGTVASLAVLKLGLSGYDGEALEHATLTREDVEELLASLSAEPLVTRSERRGLEPGRARVIVGGAAVLAEVMHEAGYERLLYSESDILDGLIANILAVAPG